MIIARIRNAGVFHATTAFAVLWLAGCGNPPASPPTVANPPSEEASKPAEPAPAVADEKKIAEDSTRALMIVQQLGGKSEQDPNLPGQPVVAVDLSEKPVSDEGLAQLVGFTELRSLNLAGNMPKITDAGLVHLKAFKKLETLLVPPVAATDKGLAEVAELTTLKSLDIGFFSPATDAGFGQLKSLTSLNSLNVSYTAMGDAGIEQLKDLPRLEKLILNNTKVTDAGLEHLQGMKSLRYLALGGCQVTKEGKQKLKSALPQCDIPFPADP